MGLRPAPAQARPRAQEPGDDRRVLEGDEDEDPGESADGDEQAPRDHQAPVRDREHEQPDDQPEGAAAREGHQLAQRQHPEGDHQRQTHRVAALEPQVEGQEDQDRDDQRDAEVVDVEHEPVRPVDVHPGHDAEAEDPLARVPGDRPENERVEEATAAHRVEELEHGVGGIQRHAGHEGAEGLPVEARGAAREVRDRGDQERKWRANFARPFVNWLRSALVSRLK